MKLGKEKILKSAEKLHLFEKVDIGLDEEKLEKLQKHINKKFSYRSRKYRIYTTSNKSNDSNNS